MSDLSSIPCTAFDGRRLLARGPLADVALAVKAALGQRPTAALLAFEDASGRVIDLDLRGTDAEVIARLRGDSEDTAPARGRGRPKLGVVAREVTLLPRHWEWLAAQPGGASQALRRLVDQARRSDDGRTHRRAAQEAAYRFMSAMAGDMPGFEEASRALFAADRDRFAQHSAAWPDDVQAYARELAWPPAAASAESSE
jgi:hypothetical protein